MLEIGHSAYFVHHRSGVYRIWKSSTPVIMEDGRIIPSPWVFMYRTESGDWQDVKTCTKQNILKVKGE